MKSPFLKHLHALRSMTWPPTWLRAWYRFAAFGQPGALESGCQLGTANGKHGASDEIPGPLGSPSVSLGPLGPGRKSRLAMDFLIFFVGVSVKIRDLASEVTDHANDLGFGR